MDLRKLFPDPENFSSADESSLVGLEMATEIYVAKLPHTFQIAKFLESFSLIALLENPETPRCAWGEGLDNDGRHLVFAFESSVITEDMRQILMETVDAQLKSQGYGPEMHTYEIIPANEYKFPVIAEMAARWKFEGP